MSKRNAISLTAKGIGAFPTPEQGKRSYIYDAKVAGLILMVTSNGTKSFVLYRKVNGRPVRITLGRYPDLSVENARKAAFEAINKLHNGVNPTDEKRHVRLEITFGQFFEEQFMKRYSEPHKKSWQYDRDQFRLHLTRLKNKRMSEIKREDVERLHADIGKGSGIYAANHALALIKVVFNKALEWGWKGENPAARIRKFKQKSRERFLLPEELPRFFAALDAEENADMKDYFYISLFTGARKSNVLAMRWQDISLKRTAWTIPETKNGDSQIVNLMSQVVSILERRMQEQKDAALVTPWVFPSPFSVSGHIMEPKTAWRRLLLRAGLHDLRIHDLRRTLGSWQAITGANTYIIGKSLGHKSPDATAIYARLYNDPVRESVERATQAMLLAGQQPAILQTTS